jgi:hypothetical protein
MLGPPQDQERTRSIGGSLPLMMVIVDAMGEEVGTLDQLLCGVKDLVENNTRLRKQLESLSVDILLQGGVILDGLSFMSESQVREVVIKECPVGDAFEVFLDTMLL